jgi:hypothetical protein
VAWQNDIQKQNILSVCKDLEVQTKNDRNVLSNVFVFPKMKIQLKEKLKDTVEIQPESQDMCDFMK